MTKQENIEELNSLLRLGPLTGLSPQTLEAIKEATIVYEEQKPQEKSKNCLILDDICVYPDKECWNCPLNYAVELAKNKLKQMKKEDKENG